MREKCEIQYSARHLKADADLCANFDKKTTLGSRMDGGTLIIIEYMCLLSTCMFYTSV